MERSQDWFNYKLLRSSSNDDPTKELAYTTHLESINKAFNACGIISTKKTHAARGSSGRMADLNGADETDIRRQGRWNNMAMNGVYLTNLPRRVMRTMARFSPSEGQFYLPRAQVKPSTSLANKVFPLVDYWYDKIQSGACEKSTAACGFLELLKQLRISFLQDSVFMMKGHPAHPLWLNQVFSDAEYLEFKR
jgi:hypothetical protein